MIPGGRQPLPPPRYLQSNKWGKGKGHQLVPPTRWTVLTTPRNLAGTLTPVLPLALSYSVDRCQVARTQEIGTSVRVFYPGVEAAFGYVNSSVRLRLSRALH